MKILLLDDTRYNLALLQKMVQNSGHEAYSADTIDKALTLLKKHAIDVIITDQVMPEMTGLDFYRTCDETLHDSAQEKRPVFVMLTSYLDEELERKAYRTGFSAVLSKPLKEAKLVDLIERTQAGEFEKTAQALHVLCIGTEDHFRDMLQSTIQNQHLEIATFKTAQSGVDYYKTQPSVTHIFCADMFPDGLTVLDVAKQVAEHTHFNDQGVVNKPSITMVITQNAGDTQKYLVEHAMKHQVRDIITLPVSAARLRQSLGDNSQSSIEEDTRPAILIIDDIVFNCSYLEKILKPYGRCLKATSGREALSLFHSNPGICLIVCDLQMPDVSGLDIYRHIRQTKQINHQGQENTIPFIFVTASTQAEFLEEAKTIAEDNSESVYFFQKPMSAKDFEEVAQKALGIQDEDPIATLFNKR
jgi:CheY-like chemotaxis protein